MLQSRPCSAGDVFASLDAGELDTAATLHQVSELLQELPRGER